MAKIAFILLCHKAPEAIIRQARVLTASGDCVSIHFDARSAPSAFRTVRNALGQDPNVTLAEPRVGCGWGEWSLVQATLNALRAAIDSFPSATHFYMISESCAPIKSRAYLHDRLDAHNVDHIESVDFFAGDWIRTGMRKERLIYRHVFNERTQPWRFYTAIRLQRALGLARRVPPDLDIRIGSQWWCLRRATVEAILRFMRHRRDVTRFFRTTWIPDETFFQTLVPHLVPDTEIDRRSPTFLMFTDYGLPVTFHNDHHEMLLGQDRFFARKISDEAHDLRHRLDALYDDCDAEFDITDEGRNLFEFLTARGREGHRIAPRFWDTESTLGQDRVLMIIVCKKWHVAKRLLSQIERMTGLPTVGYLFSELDATMPELGGIETSLDKRTRHRRALMRMLFDHHATDRLVICVDPADFDLLRDFCKDRSITRILEIECRFSDEELAAQASGLGLAGPQAQAETLGNLLPAIRNDIGQESARIRDAGFDNLLVLRDDDSARCADVLARFLDIRPQKAQDIAQHAHLLTDRGHHAPI